MRGQKKRHPKVPLRAIGALFAPMAGIKPFERLSL